jgi:hypothetical protein
MIHCGPGYPRRGTIWLLPPPPPVSKMSLFNSSCVSPVKLTDATGGEGGGWGREGGTVRKPGPLFIIQYSMMSNNIISRCMPMFSGCQNPYLDAADKPYFRKVPCIFLDNTYNEHKLHQHGRGCQISIMFNVLYVIQCIYYVIHVIYVLCIKIPLCRFQKRAAGYQWLPVRRQQAVHRLKHQQKILVC